MSGVEIALLLAGISLVLQAVGLVFRILTWQQGRKPAVEIDAVAASADEAARERAYWWNQGAKYERRRHA